MWNMEGLKVDYDVDYVVVKVDYDVDYNGLVQKHGP